MTVSPVLIVLRGNSGSGKSSVARGLRERFGYGLAWVEQDHLRRVLLREHDIPHGNNIGLIELNVRYALEAGYVTVLEGILYSPHYTEMLSRLHLDYGGHWYDFDLPFEETVKRHATRPQAQLFTPEQMRGWYRQDDRLPFVQERLITPESRLEDTVNRIFHEACL